jgi:hypothetical protein
VDAVAGMDDVVERILTTYETITVVGASGDSAIEQRRLGLDAPAGPRDAADLKDTSIR